MPKGGAEKARMLRNERYWDKAVSSFGDTDAELMIIGLSPAAHGRKRTGRAFTGDRSGEFLSREPYEAAFANQPASLHSRDG